MAEPVRIPVAASGQSLAAIHARPGETLGEGLDRTLVVMAHTFPDSHMFGHEDLLGRIENALTPEGFHSLRFDFRGCGDSDGKQEHMGLGSAGQDFSAVLDWGRRQGYQKFVILAEGLATAVALTRLNEDVRALILLWPVLDPKELAARRFGAEGFDENFEAPGHVEIGTLRVGHRMIGEMWNTDLLPFFRKVRMPTLILHGAQDEVAPVEQLDLARSYFKTPRIEITVYHDGAHGLPQANHRKYAYYHIIQFLKKYA